MKSADASSEPSRPYATPFLRWDLKNFLFLAFCLMVGTAGLPHILMRFYTLQSVSAARHSVIWTLVFICLLYFSAPALAAFVYHDVLEKIVGTPIAQLPAWFTHWAKVGLMSWTDINRDGVLQFAELTMRADMVVLASPEIAGLPYVISGLVAAGGLAAALSTADGLLLTISNALSHDLYYKIINPKASVVLRLTIARTLLVVAALIAAWVATYNLAIIVELVAWAFSLSASSFFPVLVMGVFWKRATKAGGIAGLLVGTGVTLFYMIGSRFFGLDWFGVRTIASGIFGVPAAFITIWIVSLLTPPPPKEIQHLVDKIRYPKGAAKGHEIGLAGH
ncbi:MAG: Cation/acetate symporter ActP [Actinobacteria bacterium]|nr:Cation/acetate symporter ActP [Actinomycetota bacterium]